MNKLNSGFAKLPDEDFDNKAQSIVVALTGNTNFPHHKSSASDDYHGIDRVSAGLGHGAGPAPVMLKWPQPAPSWLTSLDKLGPWARVNPRTSTDAMLATSGFRFAKRCPFFSGETVAAPGNVRLKQTGVSGVVQVILRRGETVPVPTRCNIRRNPTNGPVDGRRQLCQPPRGIGMTGLTRGKDYWARIRAIGTTGPGAWERSGDHSGETKQFPGGKTGPGRARLAKARGPAAQSQTSTKQDMKAIDSSAKNPQDKPIISPPLAMARSASISDQTVVPPR